MAFQTFKAGTGSIVGSYINITYDDIINRLDVKLSKNKDANGRLVTLAYWVCDPSFNGNIKNNKLDMSKAIFANRVETASPNTLVVSLSEEHNNHQSVERHYINTNTISTNQIENCSFYFENSNSIKVNKIFVALISTPINDADTSGYFDYTKNELCVPVSNGTIYYSDNSSNSMSHKLKNINNAGLWFGEHDIIHSSNDLIPEKIKCTRIKYRTWSEPLGVLIVDNDNFNNNYGIGVIDGGNEYGQIPYETLPFSARDYNANYEDEDRDDVIRLYTKNKNDKFNNTFGIPMGRLIDVTFAQPNYQAYDTGSGYLPRWVFNRSRIKFTIPPAEDSKGNIIKKTIILRYKVVTSIANNKVYSTEYKTCVYKVNDAVKPIDLVICPRDEGVLDNMEFTVLLSRRFIDGIEYSDDVAYKFHTFQKPTLNITYPKIIRNEATKPGFKHAKILATNLYSNSEQDPITHKYVCDTLNVMFATSPNDASNIPMFIRYQLLEFKYGRTGLLDNNKPNWGNKTTLQAVFKSDKITDYTKEKDILKCNNYISGKTGICNNEGYPILFSGRFSNDDLKNIRKEHKLWVHHDWDYVDTDKSPKVGNPWIIKDKNGNNIAPLVVRDHLDKPKLSGGTTKQDVATNILFRAGYIYLLKARMFHGAAAGAIATNNDKSEKYGVMFGEYNNRINSGYYEYDQKSNYSGEYPKPSVVAATSQFESVNEVVDAYPGWKGVSDGTSGLAVNDSKNEYTYPGFSKVDYTIFEPVCPYVSKNNIITVHPTSPQIGANQWLSFSYRHPNKNIGGLDATAYVNGTNKSMCLGHSYSGIQNGITRILATYHDCVRAIISTTIQALKNKGVYSNNKVDMKKYADFMGINACFDDGAIPKLITENISIKIRPIDESTVHYDNNHPFTYHNSYAKVYENKYLINNYALKSIIPNFEKPGEWTKNNPYTGDFTFANNHYCGLYLFYQHYLNNSNKVFDFSNDNGNHQFYHWPETQIIYKLFNTSGYNNDNRKEPLGEPLGNVYRWQPVINAMQCDNKNIKEIQIERENNTSTTKDITIGFKNNNIPYIPYDENNKRSSDLQVKYYYNDTYPDNKVYYPHNMGNYHEIINNAIVHKIFTIQEFAGNVSSVDNYNPGYPVLYTTQSRRSNTAGYVHAKENIKYFIIHTESNTHNDEYGKLFLRVPTTQDCENGIPTPDELPNVGNIGCKGAYTINGNEDDEDGNEDNVIPITRTTHYLYFKTWINLQFNVELNVEMKYIDSNTCRDETNPDTGKTTHVHGDEIISSKKFYLSYDASTEGSTFNLVEDENAYVNFGNKDGLYEVYGEDNRCYGRCLSADDISNRVIKYDGTIGDTHPSGGLEVPIMIRYTPLLQPKLSSIKANNVDLGISSINVTLEEGTTTIAKFTNMNYSGSGNLIKTEDLKLNISYPFIKEDSSFFTVSPNGGMNGSHYFENYHIDIDSDLSKSLNSDNDNSKLENLDFLGGNGICTAYNIFLIPSDPVLKSTANGDDDNEFEYFNNSDKHWNYFKQPANYYENIGSIANIRSKSVKTAGPVLVAYNVNGIESLTYFVNPGESTNLKNRCIIENLPLNFEKMRSGQCLVNVRKDKDNENTLECKYKKITDINNNLKLKNNKLQQGVSYDLVIVPVYDNVSTDVHNFKTALAGTINGFIPGSTKDDDDKIHLAGSSPLVLYNYLQVSGIVTKNNGGGSGGGYIPQPSKPSENQPDTTKIFNSDAAIVFPNVDCKKYSISGGEIPECPGFWLNNSFKLVLRMPSFRTNSTTINSTDSWTIENESYGQLDSENNDIANDFEFEDIQIHIGKITELEDYGYPDNQETKLNKLTDKEDLAKAHIISYKHFKYNDVFSKKLSDDDGLPNENNEVVDYREKLTGGALDPSDDTYKNRFITVNLANATIMNKDGKEVPIYSDYPEGYYIQFRYKTKYSDSNGTSRWSAWYGGSYDGGSHWWGDKGLNYFVPVRNFTTMYTDFRNHIKESYPGSYISMAKELSNDSTQEVIRQIEGIVGKGSLSKYGSVNDDSLNKPKDANTPAYYYQGAGNHPETLIVPSDEFIKNMDKKDEDNNYLYESLESEGITLHDNNDSAYINHIQYNVSHDSNGPKTGFSFTNHQHMWEMLYIDYIIRNMCKLYYKPKNYDSSDIYQIEGYSPLYYHLSTPNYDYEDDNGNKQRKPLVLPFEKEYSIIKNEDTEGWNRNKYYRKIIQNNDFNKLNQDLINLTTFIRNSLLNGLNETNQNQIAIGVCDVLPISPSELDHIYNSSESFNLSNHPIIGSELVDSAGLKNTNSINYNMVASNYIQRIWQNIQMICNPGLNNNFNQKIDINITDN